MRQTFKILFYIKRNSLLRNGLAPVMGRITINGTVANFSTRLAVRPERWDVRLGRLTGRSAPHQEVNRQIETIHYQINKCYEHLLATEGYVTARAVKNRYHGQDGAEVTLIGFFLRHNRDFSKRVGVSRSRNTYIKYNCVLRHIETFVREQYHRPDLPIREVDGEFLNAFESYLMHEAGCRRNTAWIYMIALKHILSMAHREGVILRNVGVGYRPRSEYVSREFLTMNELLALMRHPCWSSSVERVRDLFVFSCFTGLSFTDIRQLKAAHLRRDDKGQLWLETTRQKTGNALFVRLFDTSEAILHKYAVREGDRPLFDMPGNGWCNLCLKRLVEEVGIPKRITFHSGRHTFATTITLQQGVSIETISKLLGHKNIRTTQIYASVTHHHLTEEMDRLSSRLDPLYRPATQEMVGKVR